jgi:hypothetical protein
MNFNSISLLLVEGTFLFMVLVLSKAELEIWFIRTEPNQFLLAIWFGELVIFYLTCFKPIFIKKLCCFPVLKYYSEQGS